MTASPAPVRARRAFAACAAGAGCLVALLLAGCAGLGRSRPPSAAELVAASIAYHDPDGVWGSRPLELVIRETRPGGGERTTRLVLDEPADRFVLERREGDKVMKGLVTPEDCHWDLVAGDFSAEEVGELSCDSLRWTRGFYAYVWGLPMKLRDPGVRLGAVQTARVAGRRVLRLRVSFDPDVGSDVWDFDFAPATRALVGYRFFHDEAAGDGEWIELAGEVAGAGLRLPRARAWYLNSDDEYLGRDELESIGAASDGGE